MFRPLALIALVLIAVRSGAAQDQPPALKPSTTKVNSETRTPLILQVNYNPSVSTAYINVHGPAEKPSWIWVTRFLRVPGWQLPAKDLPVRAVRIEPRFNGETVDVRLSLFRGTKDFEKEEFVAKYHLGIGEQRTLTELKDFGIEPFDIVLLDSVPASPAKPFLDIRTNAIEIISVEPVSVPLPAFRIKIKNISDKDIAALKVDIVNGASWFFQGKEGLPLIGLGAVHEEVLVFTHPITNSPYTILVSSTVFEDGSFDGDPKPACEFALYSAGRVFWLKKLLSIIEEAIAEPPSYAPVAASRFKEKVQVLTLEGMDPAPLFGPALCKNRPGTVTTVAKSLQIYFLQEVEQIITTRPAPPVDFKAWLVSRKHTYASWLSRLQGASKSQSKEM